MNKLQETFQNVFKDQTQKTIAFFAFYFVFFVILFLVIFVGGDKNYLNQDYEKGNSPLDNKGVLSKNVVYDYKVIVDGVLHDYYGKRYGETEIFKYNNMDYYRERDQFFVNQGTWIKTDNPYQFYEFLDFDLLTSILGNAYFESKLEKENGKVEYHYLISTNTLNKIFYNFDTDLDEVPNSIDVFTDEEYNITKIIYQLDSFCGSIDYCDEHLDIEMNFEMFGGVSAIDNPTL